MKVEITYSFKVTVEIAKQADMVSLQTPWPIAYGQLVNMDSWSGGATLIDSDIDMVEVGDEWTGSAFVGPDGEIDCECRADDCPVCKAVAILDAEIDAINEARAAERAAQ